MPKISVIIPTKNRAQDVVECVNSVLVSIYKDFEIIIVDDNSEDDSVAVIEKQFRDNSLITLLSSHKDLGAGGSRNSGAFKATGKYILFVDNDNVIDPKMIEHLVGFFEKTPDCGMVGPLMLYKNDPSLIWMYFADINMMTSMARYKGNQEKNEGQYPEIQRVGHLPNCFMVLNKDFKKVKGFDEKFFIMYEEADLAEKIKRQLGKNIYLVSKAVTKHNVEINPESEQNTLGLRSTWRAFLVPRNRIYFMRKNASLFQLIAFFTIFNNAILVYYVFNLIKRKKFDFVVQYVKGFLAGFFL